MSPSQLQSQGGVWGEGWHPGVLPDELWGLHGGGQHALQELRRQVVRLPGHVLLPVGWAVQEERRAGGLPGVGAEWPRGWWISVLHHHRQGQSLREHHHLQPDEPQ